MVPYKPHKIYQSTSKKEENDYEPAWVEKIREGDSKTFEVMFLTYYGPCVGIVNHILNSIDTSESLVQDVFVKIWEKRSAWSPNGPVKSYLLKASKNKALDHIKHQKVEQRYLDEASSEPQEYSRSPNELLEETDFVAAVQTAIEGLPKRGKIIYELNRRDGLTYKEIAETLEISQKTVETQMSRVLKILRKQLLPYLPVLLFFF